MEKQLEVQKIYRINRSELWLAITGMLAFFISNYLALNAGNFESGRLYIEISMFFKSVSLFFGGYIAAVYAAPRMMAHNPDNRVTDTIYIYGCRYIVGIAFLLAGT